MDFRLSLPAVARLAVVLLIAVGVVACVSHSPCDGLPSSFSPIPNDQELAHYRADVAQAVAAGRPLSALYPLKSSNPLIVEAMGIKPGDTVADIGCGTGGIVWALLDGGAPFGRVYAVDVDPLALDFVRHTLTEARPERAGDVEIVLSTREDVQLPPDSVDVALLLNTPIHLNDNGLTGRDIDCLRTLFAAVKPGGALHVYDTENRRNRSVEMLSARGRQAFADAGFSFVREEILHIDSATDESRMATVHSVWEKPAG